MNLSDTKTAAGESAIFVQRIARESALPIAPGDSVPDVLEITWNERGRRSLLRRTRGGRLIRIILPADQSLDHGAVLVEASDLVVVAELLPCQALVIAADTPAELARYAYLVGNAHLPAEIRDASILIPASVSAAAALGQLRVPYRIELCRIRVDRCGLPRVTRSDDFFIRSSVRPPTGW